MKKKHIKKSLSLIEVVISLAMLGALLGSIMTLFSQGAGYSTKYKRKIAGWDLLESTMEYKCALPINSSNSTWNQTVNNLNYSLTFNVSNDTAAYSNGTGTYTFGAGNLYDCNVTVSWCENSAGAGCDSNSSTAFFMNTKRAKY